MINAILFIILGVILALVAVVAVSVVWTAKLVNRGHFASARYDAKTDTWRVCGKFRGISQRIEDIRANRQPGAIKYID